MALNLLETKGLIKSYGGRRVVDGLSISVGRSEIVGILGPNGAGKTTSFYMIVGIIPPESGQIFFDQVDITRKPIHDRCKLGMGYLAQESSIFRKLTVEENIMTILETLDISPRERKKRLQSLLEELNIAHLAKSKLHVPAGAPFGDHEAPDQPSLFDSRPASILWSPRRRRSSRRKKGPDLSHHKPQTFDHGTATWWTRGGSRSRGQPRT